MSDIEGGDKKLFQLVGVPRSGTTLLCGLIDQQQDVLCLSEPFRGWYMHGRVSYDDGWIRHPSRLIEELCLTRSESCIGIKETFYTQEHGPDFANEQFFRRNAEGGLVTIALVRDPRDVYASVEGGVGLRERVPMRFTNTWLAFTRWAEENAACTVTYEDLVAIPERIMGMVSDALGVEYIVPTAPLPARSGEGDHRALNGGTVSTDSIGRFSERLAGRKIAEIEDRCQPDMAHFGYAPG